MKSEQSGIMVSFSGGPYQSILATPASRTGFVFCRNCKKYAAAERMLFSSACDHDWVEVEPPVVE